jgi:hypothetical protein
MSTARTTAMCLQLYGVTPLIHTIDLYLKKEAAITAWNKDNACTTRKVLEGTPRYEYPAIAVLQVQNLETEEEKI